MISRLRICFSFLLVFPAVAATVSGKVELRDSTDAAVAKRKDYSGVVISLEPQANGVRVSHEAHRAEMVQKNKTFKPHILPVEVGTTVEFPNYDPIFHNAFSTYNGQIFDVGLYAPGTSRSVRFSRPGVVRVFCNIHAAMSAVIIVLNAPYFDTTKADGSYEIPRVPPGDYTLRVFHERATAATLDNASRSVNAAGDSVRLQTIAISESGYLPIPHKNKFGRDYPPVSDENSVYPAVRK